MPHIGSNRFTREKLKFHKMQYVLFLALIFALGLTLLRNMPLNLNDVNGGPDEYMRYDVAKYIYDYNKIPHGDDPLIRNGIWGISYAFTPVNFYIFSAMAMKIAHIFGAEGDALLIAARFVNLLFYIGTAIFCFKIASKLFTESKYYWLFVFMVMLLPEYIFVSSYVNCDGIAMFSISWIIYAVLYARENQWDNRRCCFLGLGIGFCLLTYYNAYGVIMCVILYCVLSVVCDKNIDNKTRFIFKKSMVVFFSAFLVAGWWYIRNYIIYDGDILGMKTSNKYAELYALEELKPHNRETPYNSGYSIGYMLFDMEWVKITADSFVAVFGYMNMWTDDYLYTLYYTILAMGLLGYLFVILKRAHCKLNPERVMPITKKEDLDTKLLYICLGLSCIITIFLSIYYSYFNDFQPQGRYCLPMLIPLAMLITKGISYIGEYIDDRIGSVMAIAISIYMFYLPCISIFSYIDNLA